MSDDKNRDVITLTLGAYEDISKGAAMAERNRIVAWLRGSDQPMTHTAWAIARDISKGKHWVWSDD